MGFVTIPSDTPHFNFEYDDTLTASVAEPFGAFLAKNAEADFNQMSFWFGDIIPEVVPITVQIMPQPDPSNKGANNGRDIIVFLGANTSFDEGRAALVAECSEIFMLFGGHLWNRGESPGEALSRIMAFTIVSSQADSDGSAQLWLDSSRPDFVNAADPTDTNQLANGCGVLFLYYMLYQLGFSMRALATVGGGQGNFAQKLSLVYGLLTGDTSDSGLDAAFQEFSSLLATTFPPGAPSSLVGDTNPFPLPASKALSLRNYLAVDPLEAEETVRERVAALNLGNLRATLNSQKRFSLS